MFIVSKNLSIYQFPIDHFNFIPANDNQYFIGLKPCFAYSVQNESASIHCLFTIELLLITIIPLLLILLLFVCHQTYHNFWNADVNNCIKTLDVKTYWTLCNHFNRAWLFSIKIIRSTSNLNNYMKILFDRLTWYFKYTYNKCTTATISEYYYIWLKVFGYFLVMQKYF